MSTWKQKTCLLAIAAALALSARVAEAAPKKTVLVIYHSKTGNTKAMAKAVVEGIKRVKQTRALLRTTESVKVAELKAAQGVILGCPTYFANMSAAMKRFLESIRVPLRGKIGGAFTTGGRSMTLISLHNAMLAGGVIVVGPMIGPFGRLGASAVVPAKQKVGAPALAEARALGRRVAEIAHRLK